MSTDLLLRVCAGPLGSDTAGFWGAVATTAGWGAKAAEPLARPVGVTVPEPGAGLAAPAERGVGLTPPEPGWVFCSPGWERARLLAAAAA